MKKALCFFKKGLLTAVALMLGNSGLAETVTATFDNGLPEGWTIVGTINNDADRARSGKGLYSYEKKDKTNYLITTEMEGDIEFYARTYNTRSNGYITFYTVNDDGTLGDMIKEFPTGNTSSGRIEFVKYSYTLEFCQRIAIDFNYACLDDLTYTPGEAATGPALMISGFASGSTYDFGGTPVSEGTTKDFTLINEGTEALTISSIDITGGYTITEGADLASLAPKSTATLTIATPAMDATGALTITSNDANSPYTVNLSSIYKVPVPAMGIDLNVVNFGKVTADASQEVTVSNTGDAELEVTITSSSDEFTATPASLSVAPGETGTFTITYLYNETAYGYHTATITVTPNVGEEATIAVSARVQDPNVWTENFESNTQPAGWDVEGNNWSFTDGVARGKYVHNNISYLTTPSLEVAEGDELIFCYKATANYVSIEIQSSMNGANFTKLATISVDKMNDFETYTIKGLTAGSYRFRFASDDYDLDNFEGCRLNMNAPEIAVTPADGTIDAVFGKVTAQPEAKTYIVANHGTGKMTVNITSDSEDFTVSPTTLTDIESDAPQTFTVIFNYDVESLGEKTAQITVTPTYNEAAKVTFTATATAKDPNIWEEDFEGGVIPTEWDNEGEWTVSIPTVSGSNGTRMATIRSFNKPMSLTTPRLQAAANDELTFYIGMQYDDEPLTIEYSCDDKSTWTPIEEGVANYTASGNITFKAPNDGYYYVRFTGTYAMLDDFSGFKLALKDHELAIAKQDIPTTGNQYAAYTATITVKEMVGKAEEATARLMVDGKEVATAEKQSIAANGTATFALTYTPQTAVEEAEVKIVVSYAGGELTSNVIMLNIAPAPTIDEDIAPELVQGTLPVVVVKYTAVNGWNTITMPFALNGEALTRIFGTDYEVYEFRSYADDVIKFQVPTMFVAGYPYIVYAKDVEAQPESIVFENVKIEATTGQYDASNGAQFMASFTPYAAGEMTDMYVVATDTAELQKCTEESSLKGFRGHFTFSKPIAHTPRLVFYTSEGIPTGIETMEHRQQAPEGIYNLNGQRVEKVQKGLYIINGKKTVLK